MSQTGRATFQPESDPTPALNAVCDEGWELVNGDFVLVQEVQQTRERFLSSVQGASPRGRLLGYYLFKRCEANRRRPKREARESDEIAQVLREPPPPTRY